MASKDTVSHKELEGRTSAIFLANLVNGSQEWLDLRKTGIGGSDVGTILGFNKWSSAYSLWADKTGKVERPEIKSEPMEWGNRLESVIIDKFEEVHPELRLIRDVGTWRHAERDWQLANPDAIFEDAEGNLGILEIKTAQYEDDWRNGVPRYYETQVQWYMSTFGFAKAHVAVLFHGNAYREFELEANEFEQNVALEKVAEFREFILNDQAPDFDGSTSTYETLRLQHPEIIDEDVDLGWLGVQLFSAEKEFRDAESEFNKAKSHVLAAMGLAKRGLISGEVAAVRQARGQGTPFLVLKKG